MTAAAPPPPLDLASLGRRLLPWTLLAIAPLLLTLPALGGGWVVDDRFLIAQNAKIQDIAAYRAWFSTSLFDVGGSGAQLTGQMAYYRPLVLGSYALDWLWGYGMTLTFHLTNAVLAGIAAVMAAVALRRWSGEERPAVPAILAALLWTVHPAHADSVAWISGRPDLLMAVGMLAASAGVARRLRGRPGIALEVTGTVLAYLSKEAAVMLPALAALECLAARRRGELSRAAAARAVLPQVGVAALYLAARLVWMPIHGGPDGAPLLARIGRVLETYGRYVALAVWPSDLTLFRAGLHGTAAAPAIAVPYAILGAALLVTVGALATTRARRSPAFWGAALFVILLLPVANLIPVGGGTLVAARMLFVPTLGIALAIASLPEPPRAGLRRAAAGLVALALVAGAARSVVRAFDYRSTETFWAAEAARNPDCPAVLAEQMSFALEKRRYATALSTAGRSYAVATGAWPDPRVAAGAVLGTVQALAGLTRDVDDEGLARLARFCGALADPAGTRAALDHPAVRLDVPLDGGPVAARLRDLRPLALTLRADIDSRRGADDDAAQAARASVAACPRCSDLHLTAALALARTGAFKEAFAALPRSRAWAWQVRPLGGHIFRARELLETSARASAGEQGLLDTERWMELSAWGRAWKAADKSLTVDREAGRPPPRKGDRELLAELAFRAGVPERAEGLLAGAVAPEEARRLKDEWTQSMGWAEP